MIALILLVFGFVFLVIAGIAWAQPEPRVWWGRLLAWGLACVVLSWIVEHGPALMRQ